MNQEKEELIHRLLQSEPSDDLFGEISKYHENYPYDTDGFLLDGYRLLCQGADAEAAKVLEHTRKLQPYDVDVYYLLGEAYLRQKKYVDALYPLTFAFYLKQEVFEETDFLFFDLNSCLEKVKEAGAGAKEHEAEKNDGSLEKFRVDNKHGFFLFCDLLREGFIEDHPATVGTVMRFHNRPYYIGIEDTGVAQAVCGLDVERNLLQLKGEMLIRQAEGREVDLHIEGKTLVPIASKEATNLLRFKKEDGSFVAIKQEAKERFNYYRLDRSVKIQSNYDMVIGKPVPLRMDTKKKKLVISLFIDGLSQKLLGEEDIHKVMPNTAAFFEKGMICENAFTTSDWTYPSIASLVSGLEVPEHMMFHPEINRSLPTEQEIFFEVLQRAGYYTAMFNGDWRICEPYGYTRGIDRTVTQHASMGGTIKDVVEDVMEHITAFSETNQYLWMTVPDLHDVADGLELPLSVQSGLSLEDCEYEGETETSIKQFYSAKKRKRYIASIKRVDAILKPLYDMIERNYQDGEFVFSIFSDHGQTYLNKPGQFHLSRNHANVIFMTRGGEKTGRSQEYLSLLSYPAIICQLAGVSEKENPFIDKLPATYGGKAENEYTLTETIHPDRAYQVSIHTKNHTFYLETENLMTNYGKLTRGDYKVRLLDANGIDFSDDTLTERYLAILRDRLKYLFEY